MTDNTSWTQYEDRILKFIRDQEGIQKWSTIAQKMYEQYGIKGKNGKQCKQRYMQVFDQNNTVLNWDYPTQLYLYALHDKMGNRWANIGQQLGGRTDNDVKNHFYSKIRKGLRKLNSTIKSHFKKEYKQIKQTILYKLVEGAQDRFTSNPLYNQDVWNYCREAKNTMVRMGYDEIEFNPWNDVEKHKQEIRYFIEGLMNFSKEYQRKSKNGPKKNDENLSQNTSNLQTLNKFKTEIHSHQTFNYQDSDVDSDSSIYQSKISQTQSQKKTQDFKDKTKSNCPLNWSMNMQIPEKSRKVEKINSVIILKSSKDLSSMLEQKVHNDNQFKPMDFQIFNDNERNKTQSNQLPSIPKLFHISTRRNAMIDQDDEDEKHIEFKSSQCDQDVEFQLMKEGILQEDGEYYGKANGFQFHMNDTKNTSVNRITSKGSNFSSYSMDDQQCVFFTQDSTLNMRIFTTGVGGKKGNEMFGSMDKSDKLFKSLDGSGKLFESFEQRGKKQFGMSIERSGDLKNEQFMVNSFGK